MVYVVEGSLQASGNPHKTWNQLPVDTLESALVSTQVGNDFVVERCASLRESISFLKSLTRQLSARSESITLRADEDEDEEEEEEEQNTFDGRQGTKKKALWEIGKWSDKMSKSGNLTITDVFAKQLLQVLERDIVSCFFFILDRDSIFSRLSVVHGQINGVSPAKAKAITDCYATPRKLAEAYESAGEPEREAMLAQPTAGGRKLGPALSKRVYEIMWWQRP